MITEAPALHEKLSGKDFASDQEVKWCPGCGDYSIIKQVQTVLAEMEVKKENTVFISGIGCSSRFSYYMDTYGMHTIHGRALPIALGLKTARPELDVWIATGDGDALSIGGNHFIHLMRKNPDVTIMMFNNQIYSLTKGQYSPTSEVGKITKSTPYGSVDEPFNPIELALGAKGTFVARTIDRDPKHIQKVLKRAHSHKGASFVEIYQNCPVFNDGAFFIYNDKETKKQEALFIKQGKPLLFGQNDEQGIMLDGLTPVIVQWKDKGLSLNDLWIHDEQDKTKATLLARFFDHPSMANHFPRPFGIFYTEVRAVYEEQITLQIDEVMQKKGRMPLNRILSGE